MEASNTDGPPGPCHPEKQPNHAPPPQVNPDSEITPGALTWNGRSADCYLEMYVYVLEGERVSLWALGGTFKKSQIKIVSS